LKTQLESPKDDVKIEAMKKLLVLMLNGDPAPGVIMHIIRFVTPSKNKALKKLSLIYWEICPKYQPNGKLKQEMVLVWCVLTCSKHLAILPLTGCKLDWTTATRFVTISSTRTNGCEA
jgi:coatomer subunit beta